MCHKYRLVFCEGWGGPKFSQWPKNNVDKIISQKVDNADTISKVTNNGRTTEGEYRVALPDGRVQVCFQTLSILVNKYEKVCHSLQFQAYNKSSAYSLQIVAYYADDDGFHAKVCEEIQ